MKCERWNLCFSDRSQYQLPMELLSPWCPCTGSILYLGLSIMSVCVEECVSGMSRGSLLESTAASMYTLYQ